MKIILTLILAPVALFLVGVGHANGDITYDLAADWSNTSNPNGPWSYNGGTTALPFQSNWDPYNVAGFNAVQPAWAFAPQPASSSNPPGYQIPVWFQSVGNSTPGFDMPQGQVIVHSYDSTNGYPGTDPANVTWTSPINGTILISGNTWLARTSLGRSNDWSLSFNNSLLASGTATSSGQGYYTSQNPDSFGVFTESVQVGEVVTFQVTQAPASPYGEFEGVNLTIVSVPEPSGLALVCMGAVCLAGFLAARWKLAGLAALFHPPTGKLPATTAWPYHFAGTTRALKIIPIADPQGLPTPRLQPGGWRQFFPCGALLAKRGH